VDYITRSVGTLAVPMIIAAIIALLALWGDGALRVRLATGSGTRLARNLIPALAIVGLALAAFSLLGAFATTLLSQLVSGAPLGLAVGVLLLSYAVRMRRHVAAAEQRPARGRARAWAAGWEWALVFVLVAISLFQAANDYGQYTCTTFARHFVADARSDPLVAVYSAQNLGLHAPGIREVRCNDPQAACRFRYNGLMLVADSGGQYFFLPVAWTRSRGVAVLIPQSSSLRLEFYGPYARRSRQQSTC